jgi:hypothetical protein
MKIVAGTASRRLNSPVLVRNGIPRTALNCLPHSGSFRPLLRLSTGKVRLHLTKHPNAMLPSFHSRHAGCIRLHRRMSLQEPLQRPWHSPPSVVPVNQGNSYSYCNKDLRREFGKGCDTFQRCLHKIVSEFQSCETSISEKPQAGGRAARR